MKRIKTINGFSALYLLVLQFSYNKTYSSIGIDKYKHQENLVEPPGLAACECGGCAGMEAGNGSLFTCNLLEQQYNSLPEQALKRPCSGSFFSCGLVFQLKNVFLARGPQLAYTKPPFGKINSG